MWEPKIVQTKNGGCCRVIHPRLSQQSEEMANTLLELYQRRLQELKKITESNDHTNGYDVPLMSDLVVHHVSMEYLDLNLYRPAVYRYAYILKNIGYPEYAKKLLNAAVDRATDDVVRLIFSKLDNTVQSSYKTGISDYRLEGLFEQKNNFNRDDTLVSKEVTPP